MAGVGVRDGRCFCFFPEFPQGSPWGWLRLLIAGHPLFTAMAGIIFSPHSRRWGIWGQAISPWPAWSHHRALRSWPQGEQALQGRKETRKYLKRRCCCCTSMTITTAAALCFTGQSRHARQSAQWLLEASHSSFTTATAIENRLVVAKREGMGKGRIGNLGLADANYYIYNG